MIKYVLIASMVINSILLATVTGVMPFLLYLSLLIHCAAFWYLRVLLNELNQYNKDMVGILETCQTLQDHIESIHEMEMFYGDATLKELIEHTKEVNDEIEFYVQKYILEEEGELTIVSDETENFQETPITAV